MEEAEGVSLVPNNTELTQDGDTALSRKEKRKGRKKVKRKERRQQAAEQAKQEDEHALQDPSFLEEQAQTLEKERLEQEIQLRLWLQREKEAEEEADRKRQEAAEAVVDNDDDESAWEYVEEGPAEIIWEGNEIIVRKQKVKVPKGHCKKVEATEDDHPVSNPLLPESLYQSSVSKPLPLQSSAYEDYKKLNNNEHHPNFGTEQDKTHCPFHIKTGVCRFGVNCSRAHITCEFVVITRWRAALCGEYMRSHHKVCSHGTACNFLHCFKNPHGLYEWADWDNPPPRSFSKASRRGRGHFEEDKENHKHHGRSDRRHRDDFSSKSRRPHHRDDYQMSRERRYGGCGSNDSSCEESLSVDRDHVQKERQNKSSGKRYKVRHNSKSSTEESVLVERDGLREERKHRSSDKRSREEDGRTRRKEDAKKGRHRSRSNDRHERKRHGDGSRTRGAEDERSVPRRRHRRSRESSQSDGGTSCEQRQDTREKRCDKYERYRPRSRSLTPESSERSPKDVMVSRRRKSSSSSDRRKKRHS